MDNDRGTVPRRALPSCHPLHEGIKAFWHPGCIPRIRVLAAGHHPRVGLRCCNDLHYAEGVVEDVDWTHRGEYMHVRHGITVEIAHEVVSDPERVVIDRTTTAAVAAASESSGTRRSPAPSSR